MHRVITDYTSNVNLENVHVKVYVRLRPPGDGTNAVDPRLVERYLDNPKKIVLRDGGHHFGEHAFMFDHVFWLDAQQEEIFNTVCRPQVEHVLKGYNSCCFAYGATGSGKTHTMFGPEELREGSVRGLVPRTIEYLCRCLEERRSASTETVLFVSFLEIYLDQIRDLGKAYLMSQEHGDNGSHADDKVNRKTSEVLTRVQAAKQESVARIRPSENVTVTEPVHQEDQLTMNLEIRENSDGHIFVKDLSMIPVSGVNEVLEVIKMGLRVRATHETKMNEGSSRSHTIFTVTVVQKDTSGESVSGMMHLVDLAGSERLNKSDSQGLRLREAVHINSSLTALGKVVVALDPTSEKTHVPYRDSKLTRILQNSLGGNSYTALVATLHPVKEYTEECLSTLQFANRCRNVQTNPRVNYIGGTEQDKDKRIKRLLEEVANLNRRLRKLDIENTEKMASVLRSLGIKNVLCPDGSIELSNGCKVVQNGAVVSSGNAVNFGGGTGSLFLEPGDAASWATQMMITRLNKTIDGLKLEMKDLKDKAEERKREVLDLQNELQSVRQKKEENDRRMQHELTVLRAKYETKSRHMRDFATTMTTSHQAETRKLVEDSEAVIKYQSDLLKSVPDCLRVDSERLEKARDAQRLTREEEQGKLSEQLRSLELGKDMQLESLKQQYEQWVERRDAQMSRMMEGMNRYRTKKREETARQAKELLALYDCATRLQRILDTPTTHTGQRTRRLTRQMEQFLHNRTALRTTFKLLKKRSKDMAKKPSVEQCSELGATDADRQHEVGATGPHGDDAAAVASTCHGQDASNTTPGQKRSPPRRSAAGRPRPQSARPVLLRNMARGRGNNATEDEQHVADSRGRPHSAPQRNASTAPLAPGEARIMEYVSDEEVEEENGVLWDDDDSTTDGEALPRAYDVPHGLQELVTANPSGVTEQQQVSAQFRGASVTVRRQSTTDLDTMDASALRALVRSLEASLMHQSDAQGQVVESQLTSDAMNDVCKRLQKEVSTYREQVHAQSNNYRQLLAAHQTLVRSVQKMREKGYGSQVVPGVVHSLDLMASRRLSQRPVTATTRPV